MDGARSRLGEHIALALAAGTLAASAAPAIQDRRDALKRAIARKSGDTRLGDVEDEPASREHRAELARVLEARGASKDRDVLTIAKELLALVKIDEGARDAVAVMIDEVEAAVVALSDVDVEAAESAPGIDVTPPTTSRRLIPPAEHSKTELERMALPIWQRTERFFTKALLVAGLVAAGAAAWFALGLSPNAALESCRKGDATRCWEVVAAADSLDKGKSVPDEPLRLLCDAHQDACACAGLAYAIAARTEGSPDCGGLQAASALDPRWPCTCRLYEFWRSGQQRMTHCGIPRCE